MFPELIPLQTTGNENISGASSSCSVMTTTDIGAWFPGGPCYGHAVALVLMGFLLKARGGLQEPEWMVCPPRPLLENRTDQRFGPSLRPTARLGNWEPP